MSEGIVPPSAAGAAKDRLRHGRIDRLYRLALGHEPDPAGLHNAMDGLRRGAPLSMLVTQVLESDEFSWRRQPPPATPEDIDEMFHKAFGRPAPVLDPEARALALEDYTARLLTAEEILVPYGLAGSVVSGGIDPCDDDAYRRWLAIHHLPDDVGRASIQAAAAVLPPGVAVSVVLVGAAGYSPAMARTVLSLRAQLCDRFELIAVGDAVFCDAVANGDSRVVRLVVTQQDTVAAFNLALALCRGAFVMAPARGLHLAGDAVFQIASAQVAPSGPNAAAIFADHDRIGADGLRSAPAFTTSWDPETAFFDEDRLSCMVLRTDRVRAVGGARPDYPGCEWDDLALRVIDAAGGGAVCHVPRLLFSLPTLSANPAEARLAWATRSRRRSWARLVSDRLAADARSAGRAAPVLALAGVAPARLIQPMPRQAPLVSVIIPTRDKADLLRACMDGLPNRTDYPSLEIIVVDNRSVEPRTHAYLAECAERPNVRVLCFDQDFNWGGINNLGVRASRGEVVVLLNNDTEVLDPGWLTEMVSQAIRPEVGAVGAKLLYPNGAVQHAGLAFGPGARAFHRFRGVWGDAPGYGAALAMVRQVSAVTGACVAMRRAVFDEVGGVEDQALVVTWSDVDLCLRVRERGYRVIYTPFAPLLHLELATRGPDDTPERLARIEREHDVALARWPQLAGEDPYFNANLQVAEGPTRLADPPRLAAIAASAR